MKDHSAHGGGGPEAPRDESPIAQEEDPGVAEDKEGLSRPRRRPGGARTVWFGLGWGFSLSFVWRTWKKETREPGLTQ